MLLSRIVVVCTKETRETALSMIRVVSSSYEASPIHRRSIGQAFSQTGEVDTCRQSEGEEILDLPSSVTRGKKKKSSHMHVHKPHHTHTRAHTHHRLYTIQCSAIFSFPKLKSN